MSIFKLEDTLSELLNVVCPLHHTGVRALKPLLAPALGSTTVDYSSPGGRILLTNRQYNRVDFSDFIDFATTELAPPSRLNHHTDGRIEFYEGLASDSTEPLLFGMSGVGISLVDCAIARKAMFVSTTARFIVQGRDFTDSLLATATFATSDAPGSNSDDLLAEWDRHAIYLPCKGDPEWRFISSGTYTDFLLEQMKEVGGPGAATPEQIEHIRLVGANNYTERADLFEVAKLTLSLPAYIDFMYDLVLTERIPVPDKLARPRGKPSRKGKKGRGVSYRIIRSLRVKRLHSPESSTRPSRNWRAPARSFAVRGHWRRLANVEALGKDRFGRTVTGKTWVRDHEKYTASAASSAAILTEDPGVTINIKQTLAYARDVITASERAPSPTTQPADRLQARSKPTAEWQLEERSKLSASLRYTILRRDGFKCQSCGRSGIDENNTRLEVDHIQPIANWGQTIESNLQVLCRDCNRGKSAR